MTMKSAMQEAIVEDLSDPFSALSVAYEKFDSASFLTNIQDIQNAQNQYLSEANKAVPNTQLVEDYKSDLQNLVNQNELLSYFNDPKRVFLDGIYANPTLSGNALASFVSNADVISVFAFGIELKVDEPAYKAVLDLYLDKINEEVGELHKFVNQIDLQNIANSTGLTPEQILGDVVNSGWQNQYITDINGAARYWVKNGDRIDLTPADNDFDYVAIEFQYDPAADAVDDAAYDMKMYFEGTAGQDVSDAAENYNFRQINATHIEFTDSNGTTKNYKTHAGDAAEQLGRLDATVSGGEIVVNADNGYSLIEEGAQALIDGVSYAATEVADSISSAAEAVADFVSEQVGDAADWLTSNNVDQVFAQWFAANIDDLINGNLSTEDGLISLAGLLAQTFLADTQVAPILNGTAANGVIEDVLTELGVDAASAKEIAGDFGTLIGRVAVDFALAGGDWNSDDWQNAGVATVTAFVASKYGEAIFGSQLGAGEVGAITSIVSGLVNSGGFDSGDYAQLGLQAGIAYGSGVAASAIVSSFTLPPIAVDPATAVIAAVIALVGNNIISSLFGGKKFYAGESDNPNSLLNSLYQVQDVDDGNGGTVPALVAVSADGATLNVIASDITTLLGGIGQDVLIGNEEDNTIMGGAGSDYAEGRGGDDTIVGEDGADHLSGGDGDDYLSGGDGDDILFGEAGNDTLLGDDGEEFMHLGSGDDIATSGDGADIVMGGSGDDVIDAGDGHDIVDAGTGNDGVDAGAGDDRVFGGLGNDTLVLGDGADIALGEAGNDTINGNAGDDVISGGDGLDILHGDNGDDVVSGDGGDDMITGGIGDDALSGGEGDDTILGGLDDDLLIGGTGDDILRGELGNDRLVAGAGSDTMEGGEGDDSYFISDDALDINNFIEDNDGSDAIVFSWLDEADISNLALARDGDDLQVSYNGQLLVTAVDHFNGKAVETLEIGSGKTLNIGTLTGPAGSLTTPAINVATGASQQAALDLAMATLDSDIDAAEQQFDNQLFESLSDASYGEVLIESLENEIFNEEVVSSFKRKRGKCGGHYTVYKLDKIGTLDGNDGDTVHRFEELSASYLESDYDDVITNVDKLENNYTGTYQDSTSSVNVDITLVDYMEGSELIATIATYTEQSSGNVIGSFQVNETEAEEISGAALISRIADGTLTSADIGLNIIRSGVDKLVGAWWGEVISGQGGDDVIVGNGGDDTLYGGNGADWIFGGGGNDTAYGEAGDDIIFGGDDHDTLLGNADDDAIIAGHGNDTVFGVSGDDYLSGKSGNDTLYGGSGDDTIEGGEGNDQLFGGWDDFVASDELQVNSYQSNDQYAPDIIGLTGGDYLITWTSYGQDGSYRGVYGRRYDASGTALGNEFQINSTQTYSQEESAITALNDGGFVVAWTDHAKDGSGKGIFAQRFDNVGTKVDGEFQVNNYTANDQYAPAITTLANGDYLITWTSYGQDGSYRGVYGQRYDGISGSVIGAEFRANSTTSYSQEESVVTALHNGGFVIAWTDHASDDSGKGIFAQQFDHTGATVNGEFQVNNYTANDQYAPAITTLANGDYLITWTSYGQDGSYRGIYGQRYDDAGTAVDGEILINTTTTYSQEESSVTALQDGGYIVAWTDHASEGSGKGIFAQRFDASGDKINDEFQINDTITNSQETSVITQLQNGDIVIAWESWQDGNDAEIYMKHFERHLEGNDTILGGEGDDLLHGGQGSDSLYGGEGNDTFLFDANNDISAILFDTIFDFEQGSDIIQLDNFGATTTLLGNAAFTAGGTSELRYDLTGNDSTYQLDYDGDGAADMQFIFDDQHVNLTMGDLVFGS